VFGLLADLPRKSCWTVAEHAGDADPHGMQHLLGRAVWDTDGVRDDLRDYVVGAFGHHDAVLVVDETGDLKQGTHTVGCSASTPAPPGGSRTPRSRSTWSTPARTRHDRPGALPARIWTTDTERCAVAGVPEGVEFATKPALATGMITRALQAGVPARSVAGDEVYGRPGPARRVRVPPDRLRAGHRLRPPGFHRSRVVARRSGRRGAAPVGLAAPIGRGPARRASPSMTGPGSRSPRPQQPPVRRTAGTAVSAGGCWCAATATAVSWRSTAATPPRPVPLRELVRVAGRGWTIEESFQAGKGLAGRNTRSAAGPSGNAGACWP
jgi:hypothetical protein